MQHWTFCPNDLFIAKLNIKLLLYFTISHLRIIITWTLDTKDQFFSTNAIIKAIISNKTVISSLFRDVRINDRNGQNACQLPNLGKSASTKNRKCYSSLFCVLSHSTYLHKNARNGFLQSIPFNLCPRNSMFN